MAELEVFPNIAQDASWIEKTPTPDLTGRFFENGNPRKELGSIGQRVIDVAADRLDPKEVLGIFVVGSQALGIATLDSDLDILILTKTLDYKASDRVMIGLNQVVNTVLTAQQVADFINGKAGKELKKDLVEVFVRTYGFGTAFDLANSRWVKLDKS